MSCDWHVHCLDCQSTHRFDDANHEEELMLGLCSHADEIAALDGLATDARLVDLKLKTPYGDVDISWFREHLGHQLMPIDEYGGLYRQCHGWASCGECGQTKRCVLGADHEGDHAMSHSRPRR